MSRAWFTWLLFIMITMVLGYVAMVCAYVGHYAAAKPFALASLLSFCLALAGDPDARRP
jgi:hypothetical protein